MTLNPYAPPEPIERSQIPASVKLLLLVAYSHLVGFIIGWWVIAIQWELPVRFDVKWQVASTLCAITAFVHVLVFLLSLLRIAAKWSTGFAHCSAADPSGRKLAAVTISPCTKPNDERRGTSGDAAKRT